MFVQTIQSFIWVQTLVNFCGDFHHESVYVAYTREADIGAPG